MSASMLSNEAPLELADDGSTEVLRRYEVVLHKPGLFDDDGAEIAYAVEVTLRYDHRRAERRAPEGFDARAEAARRAIKLERKFHVMPSWRALAVDPEVDVRFLRETIVPARAK